MSFLERIHGSYVHRRRVRVLCDHLAEMIPTGASVLDVGTGDGLLAKMLLERRADVQVAGVDVRPRPDAHIPVKLFDGQRLPYPDQSFDVVLFVDVLHHAEDAMALLREAVRTARRTLVVKDHSLQGLGAAAILRFMDTIGNARHGVSLPYHYWSPAQWEQAARDLQLQTVAKITKLGLYPCGLDWVFGRSLHFIAQWAKPAVG